VNVPLKSGSRRSSNSSAKRSCPADAPRIKETICMAMKEDNNAYAQLTKGKFDWKDEIMVAMIGVVTVHRLPMIPDQWLETVITGHRIEVVVNIVPLVEVMVTTGHRGAGAMIEADQVETTDLGMKMAFLAGVVVVVVQVLTEHLTVLHVLLLRLPMLQLMMPHASAG